MARPVFDLLRQTPLSPEEMLLESLQDRQVEQMIKLIGYGASLNGPQGDHDETLPLHTAVLNDFLVGVLYLLENGAEANLQDKKGWTALHYAAFLNNADICRLLLKYGANANAVKYTFFSFLLVPSFLGPILTYPTSATLFSREDRTPLQTLLHNYPREAESPCGILLKRAEEDLSIGDFDAEFLARYWDNIGNDSIQTTPRVDSISRTLLSILKNKQTNKQYQQQQHNPQPPAFQIHPSARLTKKKPPQCLREPRPRSPASLQ